MKFSNIYVKSHKCDDFAAETEAYLLLEGRGRYLDSQLGQRIQNHSIHLVPELGDLAISKVGGNVTM